MDGSARTHIPLIELNLEKCLHLFRRESTAAFDNILGYKDIKDIVRRALDSEENYNLLFVGQPASAKTLFLQGILELRRGVSRQFLGSKTTQDQSWYCQVYWNAGMAERG